MSNPIKIKQIKLIKDCRDTAIVKVYAGEFIKNYKFEGLDCITKANKFIKKINYEDDEYRRILKEFSNR